MKLSSLSFAAAAVVALCTGCAGYHDNGGGRTMGAAAAGQTQCGDGTVLPANSRCAIHGGVVNHSSGAGTGAAGSSANGNRSNTPTNGSGTQGSSAGSR